MKTIVYIDGFNLQYGLLRDTRWRWLDLEKLVRALLTPKYDIVAIKYFTARVKSDPHFPTLPNDQSHYLDALSANPLIKIIEGNYKRFRIKLPFVKEPCLSCEKVSFATVWKTEEKKSEARYRHRKTTIVFNPHVGECVELRKLSTFYKAIPRDLPSKCQLPDSVMGLFGTVIRRPDAWTPIS